MSTLYVQGVLNLVQAILSNRLVCIAEVSGPPSDVMHAGPEVLQLLTATDHARKHIGTNIS